MKLGIVIVLYYPDLTHITSIVEQFQQSGVTVAVVDNSPSANDIKCHGRYHYLHYAENIGIAQAQNHGLRKLFESGCERVMLLDQDSFLTPEDLFELNGQYSKIAKSSSIAAIGPSILCEFSNVIVKPTVQTEQEHCGETKKVQQIIASGMLLSKDAFYAVGDKEADLFIDGVDHEWCWRAATKGLGIYRSMTVVMKHRQGDSRVRFLGVTFKQGAPIRLYYQFRNIVSLSRRSYVPLYWKIRNLFAIPVRYIVNRYVFASGDERAHYMRLGLRDGVSKLGGQIPKE